MSLLVLVLDTDVASALLHRRLEAMWTFLAGLVVLLYDGRAATR